MRLSAVLLFAAVPLSALSAEPKIPAEIVAQINAETDKAAPDLIEIRRQIHMYPEVSGEEEKTAALIAAELRKLGLEPQTAIGGHGVSVVVKGGLPGPTVAYRADMDAVRSEVIGDQPYKSRVPGIKHVCGHDVHVAVGLGIARVLHAMRDELPGSVQFIFQPAEENVTGARAMLEAGVFDKTNPTAIFGVHTAPLPVGMIGCPEGVGFAGFLPFRIEISGAAEKLDSAAAELVDSLRSISTVPQLTDPAALLPLLGALATPNGPLAHWTYVPVAAAETEGTGRVIEGMVRGSGPEEYVAGKASVERSVQEFAQRTGLMASVTFDEARRLPDMHSDKTLVTEAVPAIETTLGKGRAMMIYATVPYFGEDFALFQERITGAMFFLGAANPAKGIGAFNHTPDYDVDEDCLAVGTKAMSAVLLEYLLAHPAK